MTLFEKDSRGLDKIVLKVCVDATNVGKSRACDKGIKRLRCDIGRDICIRLCHMNGRFECTEILANFDKMLDGLCLQIANVLQCSLLGFDKIQLGIRRQGNATTAGHARFRRGDAIGSLKSVCHTSRKGHKGGAIPHDDIARMHCKNDARLGAIVVPRNLAIRAGGNTVNFPKLADD